MNKYGIPLDQIVAAYNAGKPANAPSISLADTDAYLNGKTTVIGTAVTKIQDLIDSGAFDTKDAVDALKASLSGYEADIDKYIQAAKDANNSTMRGAIKGTAQNTLSGLANRRMLKGDVATDTLSSALSNVISKGATANAEAVMKGAELKSKLPSLYASGIQSINAAAVAQLYPYELLLKAMQLDMGV
jgi:hypothetical protein